MQEAVVQTAIEPPNWMMHTGWVAESDAELVRRVAARDQDAFEDLYGRYAPAAFGVARRILRVPELAQEIVQEAYAALWSAPEIYDPTRGPFRTFFLSLVHHRAVDLVRKEERLHKRERQVNPGPVESEDLAEIVVEEAELADRRREVREAVEGLPPEQREALELMYFRGWTGRRIAEATGTPLGTVKTRILAAVRKLRERLT
ncbi:MAG: RNA polymerase sigma factor [Actinomycetota bacterium]